MLTEQIVRGMSKLYIYSTKLFHENQQNSKLNYGLNILLNLGMMF